MRAPVAVIFDWCNTLVQNGGLDYEIAKQVLQRMGRGDIDVSSVSPIKVERYLEYSLGDRWKEAIALYKELAERSSKVRKLCPSDNVLGVLELLYNHNVSMGIVSNKNGDSLREEVKTTGLAEYFSVIIGSGDTSENKPSPEPIIAALEILDIPPGEHVFFVGDSISDVESARRAKCRPIVYGNANIEDVLSFRDFAGFCEFVRGLLN
ncbi:MAG: HAD family hydrolase [Anaplasma sp.]